jgi:hypothetical protein
MSSRPFRSRIALFVLVLILVAPWASASQLQGRHAGHSPKATSNPVSWSPLEILRGLFTRSWNKNGCSIDPFGNTVCQPVQGATPASQQDAGCQVDPNGSCIGGH